MSGSMQAPRCSRRTWPAFAESPGKGRVPTRPGWVGQKAGRVHRDRGLSWQARGGWVRQRLGRVGEHGKGRVHRDRSLSRQARRGWVRRRLERAGVKEATTMKGSMGIDHITLCVKNLAAAEYRSEERRVGKECRARWSACQ